MSTLKCIIALAIGGYFAFVAFLYVAQRLLLYHPRSTHPSPTADGLPTAEEAAVAVTQ